MSLLAKHIIITVVAPFVIMAALALLVAIFQLAFHAQRGAAPSSPVPPEARHSPRASPMIGQSPSPLVSQGAPENRDSTRPVETVAVIKPGSLTIPVVGARPEQLRDTYSELRAEGRTHNALDIMAKCDTQIVAATAGKIVKLFQSERGGVTIYQMAADNRTVYYYAHLARYAAGLAEGRFAQEGEVIGYVGDTGNVVHGACHLHFAIWTVTDPKRYWDGENINPYPLLRPSL
jgi:murein DD-endopeptidase MepM/ murein hydrolase activator NlpD